MIALVLGTLLTLAALAFVLAPLYTDAPLSRRDVDDVEPARAASNVAVEALREIEFDRATGKLSDDDYATLKARYTQAAVDALRAGDRATHPPPVDDALIEATIARVRARHECAEHGFRPEPDALYCSACGRFLARTCARCGGDVTEPGAVHCSHCGVALVAA